MKPFSPAILFFCLSGWQVMYGQAHSINRMEFFSDTSIINATFTVNTGKLFGRGKKKGLRFPATLTTMLPDSTNVNDQVLLQIRGKFRRSYCYLPPLKVIFNYNASSTLSPLKSLKLVSECAATKVYDQYLLKEFIIYKIYNLLTEMSFRARLLNVSWQDSSGRKKTITEHAFLIEDIKDLAKRNKCKEWKKGKLRSESTDRRQMTMVAIFEYMIGNTDWGVSGDHNTTLVQLEEDTLARPFVVPYDFDYSGLVNTDYAIPDEKLGIESVTQRLYRGFPRSLSEINDVLDVFLDRKEKIYAVIRSFHLLTSASKREMTDYLDGFYDLIKKPALVKYTFIDHARTE